MLYMYTKNYKPKDSEIIFDVEAEYNFQMPKYLKVIKKDKIIATIFKHIDQATIDENGKLHTPFGECSFENCSTGTKAAILAYLYKDVKGMLINVSECGPNVIRLLATLPINTHTYNSSYTTFGFTDEKITLNNKVMTICESTGRIADERHR